jgi:hypothetical protein
VADPVTLAPLADLCDAGLGRLAAEDAVRRQGTALVGLDLPGGEVDDGVSAIQYDCHGSPNQQGNR